MTVDEETLARIRWQINDRKMNTDLKQRTIKIKFVFFAKLYLKDGY